MAVSQTEILTSWSFFVHDPNLLNDALHLRHGEKRHRGLAVVENPRPTGSTDRDAAYPSALRRYISNPAYSSKSIALLVFWRMTAIEGNKDWQRGSIDMAAKHFSVH